MVSGLGKTIENFNGSPIFIMKIFLMGMKKTCSLVLF